MTDFIEQELLADSPVFSGGAPVANGEHTLAAIGGIDLPDEATFDDGGDPARSPDILGSLAVDLERAGLAGEKRTSQIIYLAATSRLFSQPLSVAVKGPSSGGKSYTVQSALRFLPQEACFTLTSASEKGADLYRRGSASSYPRIVRGRRDSEGGSRGLPLAHSVERRRD